VKDSGCGISHQNQSKLFKLFGYLDETSELNTQGVGLGLYITKMIVNQFEGEVSVKSEMGQGSSFFLNFVLNDRSDCLRSQFQREINKKMFWGGLKLWLPPSIANRQSLVRTMQPKPSQFNASPRDFENSILQPLSLDTNQQNIAAFERLDRILIVDDEAFNL